MENFSKPRSFLPPPTHSHPLPKALARSMPPSPDATVPDANPKGWLSIQQRPQPPRPLLTPSRLPAPPHPGRASLSPSPPVRRSPGPRLPTGRAEAAGLALSPLRIPGSQTPQPRGPAPTPAPTARFARASPVPDSGSAAHPAGLASRCAAGSGVAARDAGLVGAGSPRPPAPPPPTAATSVPPLGPRSPNHGQARTEVTSRWDSPPRGRARGAPPTGG